jgi:diadenosine tetraphosphate (Ap4A) HIT family hydrolase
MYREDNCVFCAGVGEIIHTCSDFFLRLDDSPLVEGHALICPVQHYPSFADLPSDMYEDLANFLEYTRNLMLKVYGTCIMFEHGRTASCLVRNPRERFCHHAHLHVLPVQIDIVKRISSILSSTTIENWQDFVQMANDGDGYLYIETQEMERLMFRVVRPIGTHFLRICVAEEIGMPNRADWIALFNDESSLNLLAAAKTKFLNG